MNESLEEKRMLYLDACMVARHLAGEVGQLFKRAMKLGTSLNESHLDSLLPGAYEATQVLGDYLNAHDAVDPNDEWVDPIFLRLNAWHDSLPAARQPEGEEA